MTNHLKIINNDIRREWEREILTSFVKAKTLHEQEQGKPAV